MSESILFLFICIGIVSPVIFVNIITRVFAKHSTQIADINQKFVVVELEEPDDDHSRESCLYYDEYKLDFTC
ncbi:hypothetical protein HDV01_004564 [Terramyces sp. JEL0728]|nr:hypothetical protein HDV01_004564 [Terramyces sp. JEL0728]